MATVFDLITGLNGHSNFERNGGALAKRNRYERSILLLSVVLLYREGIVAGCEHTLDELRRVRSCTLVSQR